MFDDVMAKTKLSTARIGWMYVYPGYNILVDLLPEVWWEERVNVSMKI